jgi:hypothetical protein
LVSLVAIGAGNQQRLKWKRLEPCASVICSFESGANFFGVNLDESSGEQPISIRSKFLISSIF